MPNDKALKSNGDMRDQLVNNLRNQARQSREARIRIKRTDGRRSSRESTVRISIKESEPQVVLLKNRSEDLTSEVLKLRRKYANLLEESSSD